MAKASENPPTSKAGPILLMVGVLLAAGTIGYNLIESEAPPEQISISSNGPLTIDELRQRVDESPDSALAWQELGFAYFSAQDFGDAAAAYERAVEIADNQAILWSALGEARVMASQRDPMPQEALAAFQRANEIDPTDPRARYFLAVKRDLDGDHDGAIEDWLALLSDTPPGAAWETDLVRTIQQIGQINDLDVEDRLSATIAARSLVMARKGSEMRGPSQEQIAAAGALSASDQRAMAEGMVAQLEARLEGDPSNLDGWVMLMRSRMTLGEPDKAKTALDAAVAANPAAEPSLREQARQLGIQ